MDQPYTDGDILTDTIALSFANINTAAYTIAVAFPISFAFCYAVSLTLPVSVSIRCARLHIAP